MAQSVKTLLSLIVAAVLLGATVATPAVAQSYNPGDWASQVEIAREGQAANAKRAGSIGSLSAFIGTTLAFPSLFQPDLLRG